MVLGFSTQRIGFSGSQAILIFDFSLKLVTIIRYLSLLTDI